MNRYSALLFSLIAISGCTATSGEKAANIESISVNDQATAPTAEMGGGSEAALAEAVVVDLYKKHDAKKSPFFQTKDRALVDKYFARQLADLIWKDAVSSTGEVGILDADPLYFSQDIEIKDLKIWPAEIKGDKANVKVTFNNYNDKKSFTYSLTLVNNAWKIADINYGEKETLLTWLKSPPETIDVEQGDFRGKYFVGETSCTVEYKNKGYAVKWAKGRGDEYFSLMEGTTFASSTVESEANKFVFDDDNYNSGTFYRADGKAFPVRRAK